MRLQKNQPFPSDLSLPLCAPRELCDPSLLHIHRLPPRATVIPAQKSGIYYQNKEESDRIFSLNGDYRFALFSQDAPQGFELPDFDDSSWDILDVPSMWQFRGYGEPAYPNVEYPFPFQPPYICRLNPVGCYRRRFLLKEISARTLLHFEGVDNAFYVFINGSFAGFSKGSRLPAEFDITPFLKKGENTLAVKVYTYSDASYLENQDMLLASGIFRDVYLLFTPQSALWDYEIITDTRTLACTAVLFAQHEDTSARFTLNGQSITVPFENKTAVCSFTPDAPVLWNAEQPFLYNFTLEILCRGQVTEIHSKRVGFCKSEIKNQAFCINDTPVLLKGINRHENDCQNGRAITKEQILADLKLLKASNINAIRCSHYPNNPAFYEYASELGFYVMDEGDLESHGCGITGDQGFLNKSPEWLQAFMDRTIRMAERDKNETCIVIWSVGNEIGAGQNAEACAEYLRSRRDPKPVQYHALNSADQAFIGCGYPNLFRMEKTLAASKGKQQPILLIEYAHAMGNGPGNLEHMWNFVLKNPEFSGGYVWEFRSHGMRRENEDGTVDYLYGGDFHDDNHWSNFTIDGFLTSNGTPKPTFTELKYVYAPICFFYEKGRLTLYNTRDFTDTSEMLLEAEVLCDAQLHQKITIPMPAIAPRSQKTIELPLTYSGHDCALTLRIIENQNTVALKQFPLPGNRQKTPLPSVKQTAVCTWEQDAVSVTGEQFVIRWKNGVPVFYQKDGITYFDRPMQFVTYRAETDNDGIVGLYPRWIKSWEQQRLHKMRFFTQKTSVVQEETQVTVKTNGILTADHCFTGFTVDAHYTVSHNGLLRVCLTVKPYGEMPMMWEYGSIGKDETLTPRLPRFGVCFALNKNFDTVRWFGRGPEQNYTDSIAAAPVGLYEKPLQQLNFAYDVPQETGTRTDIRFLQAAAAVHAFTVYGNDTFSFSYHPWKLDALRAARHPSELKEDPERNYLYIDYRMRALGSFSCGPNPEKEYDFEPHDFQFVFALNGETGKKATYKDMDLGPKTKKLTEVYIRPRIEEEREEIECRSVEGRREEIL